jgi:beta-fructofuranosidase
VRNFECPNLFPLDGRWVLIVSPNRVCEYWVGDLDITKMQFVPTAHGVVDSGDSYASNISVDESGRTLLWFWGRTNTPQGKGWAGVMTMPRALSIGADGYLRQRPVAEFQTLRGEPKTFAGRALENPFVLDGLSTDCAEIEAEFSGFGNYGVELGRSSEGKAGIVVALQGPNLMAGTARAFVGNADRHRLRIFLDKRTVEIFVDDGVTAMFKSFDASPKDLGIAVFGQPAAFRGFGDAPAQSRPAPKLDSLTIWPMRGAKFDVSRFR